MPALPKIGVSIGPGLTTLTRMPADTSSAPRLRPSERTAALLAAYSAPPGSPLPAATEALRTIAPPGAISGKAFCTVK